MATGERNDPYFNYNFAIEINGIVKGFADASGLQSEAQTEDFREGGVNEYARKIVKSAAYQNLTLKRGLTDGDDLWQWHRNTLSGKIERKNLSIILLNHTGDETWRWNFVEALPVKWTGPDLKAGENSVAFETLEFVHHGFDKT